MNDYKGLIYERNNGAQKYSQVSIGILLAVRLYFMASRQKV